jgi:ribokinase
VRFVGLVGQDDMAGEARRDLEDAGVDVSLVRNRPTHTGVAGILVDEGGDNLIAVASGANAELDGAAVTEALGRIDLPSAVVAANLEVPDQAVAAAAEVAADRGWRFLLNPAPARAVERGLLARCSVVVPNEREAAALGSVEGLLDEGVGAVVVTRGREGADLHRAGRPAHRQPAFPVEAADTTGAGDAFCAALAWALAEGRHLEDAVTLAAAAGALACRGVGARASLPDRAEVERLAGWA